MSNDDLMEVIIEQSRNSCKNCKYSGPYTMGWMPCLNEENVEIIKQVVDDFHCNRWEPRNDYYNSNR